MHQELCLLLVYVVLELQQRHQQIDTHTHTLSIHIMPVSALLVHKELNGVRLFPVVSSLLLSLSDTRHIATYIFSHIYPKHIQPFALMKTIGTLGMCVCVCAFRCALFFICASISVPANQRAFSLVLCESIVVFFTFICFMCSFWHYFFLCRF